MSVSVVISLDTRRVKKKTGKYPVKLLITYKSKSKRYQTVFELTQDEFNALNKRHINKHIRTLREELKQIQHEAENIVAGLQPFSFEEFEKDYILNNPSFHQRKSIRSLTILDNCNFNKIMYDRRFPIFKLPKPEGDTILSTFLFYISKLLSEHRIRMAANYQTSYNKISRFRGNVRFVEVSVAYLKQLEAWMLEEGCSITTVGIYTRCLRAVFNEAIFQGVIKREKCYPFGRRLYQPPAYRNIKKALSLEEVSKIYYYQPEYRSEKKAKDFWIFSYLANGINPTDIANLKYKNINGEYFIFERAKTLHSTRLDPKQITIFISEDLQQIIDYWGNKDKSPNNYIFPILEYNITPLRKVELTELSVHTINDWMDKIRKKLGIQRKERICK